MLSALPAKIEKSFVHVKIQRVEIFQNATRSFISLAVFTVADLYGTPSKDRELLN
jgi:hypothetical protein